MAVEILDLINSPNAKKRFRITLKIDDHIYKWDFGDPNGSTYIDHGDKTKRQNYRRRHCANPVERNRIENLIPSPALFSMDLLWGDSTDLFDNLIHLQREFNERYK
jgi:hypothetical protein